MAEGIKSLCFTVQVCSISHFFVLLFSFLLLSAYSKLRATLAHLVAELKFLLNFCRRSNFTSKALWDGLRGAANRSSFLRGRSRRMWNEPEKKTDIRCQHAGSAKVSLMILSPVWLCPYNDRYFEVGWHTFTFNIPSRSLKAKWSSAEGRLLLSRYSKFDLFFIHFKLIAFKTCNSLCWKLVQFQLNLEGLDTQFKKMSVSSFSCTFGFLSLSTRSLFCMCPWLNVLLVFLDNALQFQKRQTVGTWKIIVVACPFFIFLYFIWFILKAINFLL